MRLADLRKNKNISQKNFSEIFNVAQNTVSQWETGKRDPDTATLKKIADFFDVSVDYLLGNDIEEAKKEIANAVADDKELYEFWNELKEREDLQILCKQTKSLSPTTIKRIIKYIKIVEDEEALED